MARLSKNVVMIVKFRQIFHFSLVGALAVSLGACQGSNLGNSLENAIAPASSPSSDVGSEQKALEPTTSPTPEPKPSPVKTAGNSDAITEPPSQDITNKPDRGSVSLTAASAMRISQIALSGLITPKNEQNSLKSIFYIGFGNPSPKSGEFSDLETLPSSLRDWIKDLNKLGTITPKVDREFRPNTLISRREYARWLIQTNNRLYKNQPSRQIRFAQPSDLASFPDIPSSHPDFTIIQGLANAGLIGGTGDRFRPNDPLLREELVQWKIPLDLRQPLPNAMLENVSQAWGFKDSDRISENALSAIFADAQLRDISNIRRSFGFTTLLQPQKPVTRAEAAASLWYFGTATDGISVAKSLESER